MIASVQHPVRALLPSVTLLVTLCVTLVMLLVPAGAARAADDDASWTVQTGSGAYGAARSSFTYSVNPGEKVDDVLVVSNHGDEELDLGVYASDGYTTESGDFDLLKAGETSKFIGAWTTSDADSVAVAPGATVEVPFTLNVPENATPGDYGGGIVTSLAQPDQAQGINVDRRLGVRIAVRVGGDLQPAIAVEKLKVDFDGGLNPFAGGDATLSYSIRNTGNAIMSATQTEAVTGPFGWLPGAPEATAVPPQLLPGEDWEVSVPVHGVPALFLLIGTVTVTPTMVDASGSTSALPTVSGTALGWAVPWTALVLLVILAAVAIGVVRFSKHRRAQQQAEQDARVQEAVELALATKGAARDE